MMTNHSDDYFDRSFLLEHLTQIAGGGDSQERQGTMSQSAFTILLNAVFEPTSAHRSDCPWPPRAISRHRDLDLTLCFERIVLLPALILIFLLFAIGQIVSKSRRLKKTLADNGLVWRKRASKSERVCRAKCVLLSISALLAGSSFILSAIKVRDSPYSLLHYGLYTLFMVALVHLTTINHHTSRTSSTLILLFWPMYLLISIIRIRTMIITGELSGSLSHNTAGRLVLARESLWIASIVFGWIDFMLELYSPEKKWKKWRAPWSKTGKIALDEEDEEDDSVDGLINDGSAPGYPYEGVESPVLVANIYERLSFSWLTPLLSLGTRKFLGEEDMWSLPPTDSAEALSNRLHVAWEEQRRLAKEGKKKKPSLKIAIAKAFGGPYFVAGVLKALYDSTSFLQPQLLRLLLRYVSSYNSDAPMPAVAGYGISILMFLTAVISTSMLHQYFDRCFSTSE